MGDITAAQHITNADGKVIGWQWVGVASGDVCVPLRVDEVDDLTVSIHGTAGSSTSFSVALRVGNLDDTEDTNGLLISYIPGTNMVTSSAIALTAVNTGALVLETGVYFQPVVSGMDSSTDLNICLVGK